MAIVATCEYVRDGNTFRTTAQMWIRLARVNAPELNDLGGEQARKILIGLILQKPIAYEPVETDAYGNTVAEVWANIMNINNYMRSKGYL